MIYVMARISGNQCFIDFDQVADFGSDVRRQIEESTTTLPEVLLASSLMMGRTQGLYIFLKPDDTLGSIAMKRRWQVFLSQLQPKLAKYFEPGRLKIRVITAKSKLKPKLLVYGQEPADTSLLAAA